MERPWGAVPDAAQTAPVRDPLLHPRSRRLHHRGRANHRPAGRLVARRLARHRTPPAIPLKPPPPCPGEGPGGPRLVAVRHTAVLGPSQVEDLYLADRDEHAIEEAGHLVEE